MPEAATHEEYRERDTVKGSSDRAFGIVFSIVFLIVGLFPLVGGGSVTWWPFAVSAIFLVAAVAFSSVLAPLNKVWTRFGLLLHRVTNPIIMGILFFIVVTPVGLVMRLFGKRFLHQELERGADSYWIRRNPPGPAPDTMKQQF